jgi:FKBP-type peptidyl-prolyl cis-trans isomerase SlyD
MDKAYSVTENVVVSLEYVLSVDGEVVDSTSAVEPIRFIQGHSQVIPALERELEGMALGESKEIYISAKEGYGDYNPAMVTDITRDQFPEGFVFVLGGQLRIQDTSGNNFSATIRGIGPDRVQLDLNHPLAGKDLLFQTRVVDLRCATDDEIDSGTVLL